jgi:hypothetical protein
MTRFQMTDATAAAPPAAAPVWEACGQCGSPLDEQQRYCVTCGTRRANADDPATRYFAAAAAARRAPAAAATPRLAGGGLRAGGALPAVLLALLPLTAGVGVLVGRGSSSDDDLLIQALRAQKAPVVNVTASGAAGDATAPGRSAKTAAGGKAAGKKRASAPARRTSDGATVLATGPAGDARKLEGAKTTKEQLKESAKAVEQINKSKGKAYVESQRNLPDQIVIP